MKTFSFFIKIMMLLSLTACAPSNSLEGISKTEGGAEEEINDDNNNDNELNSALSSLFKVSVESPLISTFVINEKTGVPNKDKKIQEIVVYFEEMKLLLTTEDKGAWVVFPDKEGHLNLRNETASVDFGSIEIPRDVNVSHLRFGLKNTGNYILFDDNSRCDFKNVAAIKKGLKFIFQNPVNIKAGKKYEMKIQWDVEKSVILKGNGQCILKPIIHPYVVTETEPDLNNDMELEKTPALDDDYTSIQSEQVYNFFTTTP